MTHVWAMSQALVKGTSWHFRPSKNQISLRIRAVWSEYSIGDQRVAKGSTSFQA